jgi:hypothetical protein
MMRISTLLLVLATACGQLHGSAFLMHYDVSPRKMVLSAIDAARELHYDIVALESADTKHNAFLALADGSSKEHATALLVQIAWRDEACPPVVGRQPIGGCGTIDVPTQVAITPLAWANGHELPGAQVPAETKVHAEELMYAIYDRNRSNRHLNDNL